MDKPDTAKAMDALRERIRDFIHTDSRDIEDWKEEMSILQTIVGGISAHIYTTRGNSE